MKEAQPHYHQHFRRKTAERDIFMDNNIARTVYDTLATHTEEIGRLVAERDALDAKIKSGRYSEDTVTKDFLPKWRELRDRAVDATDEAIKEALSLVDQYRQDVAKINNLDPAELTDDLKLLQPGITLLPGDIQGILKRNSDNRTMTQIVLRYAQEHNIDTGGVIFVGGQQEREGADNLAATVQYFRKWMGQPNAREMLDKFFGMEG